MQNSNIDHVALRTAPSWADLVPLAESMLWGVALLVLAFILRHELTLLRLSIRERLAAGASFEVGPIKLGELKR